MDHTVRIGGSLSAGHVDLYGRSLHPMIGPVNYYNVRENQYNLGVLSKSSEYRYQKEYRIAFEPNNGNDFIRLDADAIIVDIGDISTESIIIPKEEFCGGFIIKEK